ncbi:MAG: sigma-70 family RNA polymerase sigma factor [Polyangiaceae bacterium]
MALEIAAPANARPLTIDEVYRAQRDYVARLAHRILARDTDVDDVVQDVFVMAMSGLAKIREPEAVKGWLRTVTVRRCQRRLRFRKFKGMLGFEESESYEHVASPDASPEQRALLARAYAVLDKLPAAERVAWVLHEMEGEKLEDVARHLGCSLATVKRRIVAAKKALEENLS